MRLGTALNRDVHRVKIVEPQERTLGPYLIGSENKQGGIPRLLIGKDPARNARAPQ